MTGKEWADRLPLSNLLGFSLFAGAVSLLYRKTGEEVEADICANMATTFKADGWDVGVVANARLSDFIFLAEHLYTRLELALFVAPVLSDRLDDRPISQNLKLLPALHEVKSLLCLWYNWHWDAARVTPHPREFEIFPQSIEHIHFCNYLAHVCEPPAPSKRGHGSAYRDGAEDAAQLAWMLLCDQDMPVRAKSVSEAVRWAIEDMQILPPPRDRAKAEESEGVIYASSPNQAEKRVRKYVEAQLKKFPPQRPD